MIDNQSVVKRFCDSLIRSELFQAIDILSFKCQTWEKRDKLKDLFPDKSDSIDYLIQDGENSEFVVLVRLYENLHESNGDYKGKGERTLKL